jgi:hypothetical protein
MGFGMVSYGKMKKFVLKVIEILLIIEIIVKGE